MTTLRVGTRGSKLALAQTRWTIERLRKLCPDLLVEERVIHTTGDRVQDRPLAAMGTKGVFIRELEAALAAGEIGAAVLSLKDLPSELAPEFALAAVPPREDFRDCLVCPAGGGLDDLAAGAIVATGSPRRRAQLLAMRPDLGTVEIRGNVDTRLRKAREGACDAVLLAVAGLKRLGLDKEITAVLEPEQMTPAPGQGALGIECRADDAAALAALAALNHPATHQAVAAERALAARLGAAGIWRDGQVLLCAVVASPDGAHIVRSQAEGPAGQTGEIAAQAAEELLRLGAREILENCSR